MTAAGAVSYILQFRMGGREASTRRYTIGSHGSPWTPVTARAEAERLAFLIAQGVDPVEADKQRRRDAVDLAFSHYGDRFADSCKGTGWRRLVLRSLRLHLKPVLSSKPLQVQFEQNRKGACATTNIKYRFTGWWRQPAEKFRSPNCLAREQRYAAVIQSRRRKPSCGGRKF